MPKYEYKEEKFKRLEKSITMMNIEELDKLSLKSIGVLDIINKEGKNGWRYKSVDFVTCTILLEKEIKNEDKKS